MSSFHNRKRAAQLLDFKGMTYGKCSPTDLDFSIDFQQKCFVFGEIKGKFQKLSVGQRIHLEGLVKGLRKGGLEAFAVFAKHDTVASEDVIIYDCFDTMVYDGNSWEATLRPLGDTMNELYHNYLENKQ